MWERFGSSERCRLDGENLELEAMRALQYEGSRSEVAVGFKESGNEMVKAKRWKDGKELYTQALEVLHQESKQDPKSDTDQGAEIQKEKKIEEACYINRALCNLELRMSPLDSSTTQISFSPPLLPGSHSAPPQKTAAPRPSPAPRHCGATRPTRKPTTAPALPFLRFPNFPKHWMPATLA